MLLSDEDKVTFREWLNQEVISNEGLLKVCGATSVGEQLAKKFRAEILACKVVLKMLEGEKVTI